MWRKIRCTTLEEFVKPQLSILSGLLSHTTHNALWHSGPENLKKSRQKNSWHQINQFFFSWNCIFGNFILFPCSEIDFWPLLKLQKMEFVLKSKSKIAWNWFIWFHEFIWPGLFLNYLAHCVWGWAMLNKFFYQKVVNSSILDHFLWILNRMELK